MDMDHGSSGTLTSELGNGWKLGRHANNAYGCVGYFQEWRFSTIARWTSDFTVY